MTSASNTKIYPDYCHSLSPTINKWCPLRATDVFALRDVGMFCDGKSLYHHGNHPIKWVRLTGVIVAADEYAGRRVYTLDDSSGMCIECATVAPPEAKSAIVIPIPRHLDQLNALNRMGAAASNTNTTATEHKSKDKLNGKANQQPSVQEPHIPWEEMDVGAVVKVKGKIGEFRDIKQIEVIKIEVMKGLDAEVKCWNEVLAFRVDVLRKPWVVDGQEEETCRRAREKELRRAKRSMGESEEVRRKRKESERVDRVDRAKVEEKERRNREKEAKMLPPPPPKTKSRCPSLAVWKAAAGKYDALGI